MKSFFRKKIIFSAAAGLSILTISVMTLVYGNESIAKEYSELSISDEYDGEIIAAADMVRRKMNYTEQAVRDNITGKKIFTEVYGLAQMIMMKDEIRGFVNIKDKDGFLYSGAFYIEEDDSLELYAKKVRKFADAAGADGAKTMFISFPEKSYIKNDFEKGMPVREYDYIQDEFLTYLMGNRVDSLDLRNSLKRRGSEKDELYYRTDKAMTTYGSFEVFCSIVSELDKRYGMSMDPENIYTDRSNYTVEEYPGAFIGNMAREAGSIFSGRDDFEIYIHAFPQEFRWEYVNQKKQTFNKVGDSEILMKREYLNNDDIYARDPIRTYLGGLNDWDKITNLKKPDAPKILCIRDDNFSAVATFLAPLCSELHLVNPSADGTDITKYIRDNEFDLVLYAVSASRINERYFQ